MNQVFRQIVCYLAELFRQIAFPIKLWMVGVCVCVFIHPPVLVGRWNPFLNIGLEWSF